MLSAAVSGEKTFFVFFFNTLSLMICCVPDVLQALNKQVIGVYETSGYPQPQLSTDKGGSLGHVIQLFSNAKSGKNLT